ncbi:hydrogenase maturation nickel metallochaperone HypA/HybF [Bacillus tuaregi]|uniref:hydrogenase maturation nickel metallochaperone HypA/HybF n=1 Tax=Bacillus tuaregi TaxID=1816695 RepID=UPI0008F8947D|nr:hydrogenase maturation nickel metallochaperone HypA [Bacillus tuaregi]
MHEMALMADILNIVQEDAHSKGIKKLTVVEIIVGELSNAMPDALQMAFAVYKEQNPSLFTTSATLLIHIEEALAECVLCHTIYKPGQKLSFCPQCHFPSGKMTAGETFQILSYEGERQ